MVQELFIVYLA